MMNIEKIKVNGRIYDIRDVEDVKKEETRAVAAEEELMLRIQGTSAKSDSRKDPFKFIGPTSDEGYTYEAFNAALDDLLYSNGVVGFNSGYFRARVQWREVEIKNIVLSTSSQNIVQVVSGAIIIDNGLIVADNAGGYTTLMRQHVNGNWGEWKETYASSSSGGGGEVSPELEAQVNENTANIAQNASDIKKLMDKEFPISVTLSVSNSVKNILEPDGNYTFSWSIKKGNDKVTPSSISLTVNGKAITSVTTNDTSYTYNYNSGGNVSPKLEANLVVTIEGNPHEASTSVTFVYPSYIGVVDKDFAAENVDGIKKLAISISSIRSKTYVVPVAEAPQKVVYAYPKSFGALSSIKDSNNLDMLNDFESSAQDVYVNTEYYVYILRDATMNKGTVTLKFS